MAGYSATPLIQKIGVRPGARLQLRGGPADLLDLLAPLPEGVAIVPRTARTADCVLLFETSTAALERSFSAAMKLLPADGMLWIGWPKRAAKVETDITEDVVRRIGLAAGLVDVKVCAITDVWSGLKFVRRLRDR